MAKRTHCGSIVASTSTRASEGIRPLLVLSRLEGNCLVPSTVSSTGLIQSTCDNAEVKDFLASASNLHFSGFCEMCGYRFVVLLIGCRTL
ncbi:hypothetical protein Syun_020800 [Stephania yunnanensis]|uniref:Uncharacterized protein n=1 Tax=Stephania yunnanensis TaxID=152371 RepID=A0AAP0IFA6_9MAGN